MKATIILAVLAVLTMTVLAGQPVNPRIGLVQSASRHAHEPVWMLLSGAALLILANTLRRYLP